MNDGKPDMVFADAELVKRYVSFRMSPPQDLILKVVDFVKQKGGGLEQSVDVGCGSGQSTAPYSPFFTRVTGIDVSTDQLQHAQQANNLQNVSFREGQAEDIPFADSTVDLVTVCAAVHWFDHDKFYKEVDRVLRPGGVLAVYSYLGTDPIYKGKSYKHLVMQAWGELEQYVGHQHHHLKTEYSQLKSCYPEEDVHYGEKSGGFIVERESSLEEILGYMSSWSHFKKMEKAEGPMAAKTYLTKHRSRLCEAMGINIENVTLTRRNAYFLRMWRKPSK